MKLVICEKPSVGAAVAAALGVTGRKDGYIEVYVQLFFHINLTIILIPPTGFFRKIMYLCRQIKIPQILMSGL